MMLPMPSLLPVDRLVREPGGSDYRRPNIHRRDVDAVSLGLRILFHDGASLSD